MFVAMGTKISTSTMARTLQNMTYSLKRFHCEPEVMNSADNKEKRRKVFVDKLTTHINLDNFETLNLFLFTGHSNHLLFL